MAVTYEPDGAVGYITLDKPPANSYDKDFMDELGGAIDAAASDAGVNVDVLYSDHDGRLIVIVDDSAPSPDEGENVRRDRGP